MTRHHSTDGMPSEEQANDVAQLLADSWGLVSDDHDFSAQDREAIRDRFEKLLEQAEALVARWGAQAISDDLVLLIISRYDQIEEARPTNPAVRALYQGAALGESLTDNSKYPFPNYLLAHVSTGLRGANDGTGLLPELLDDMPETQQVIIGLVFMLMHMTREADRITAETSRTDRA